MTAARDRRLLRELRAARVTSLSRKMATKETTEVKEKARMPRKTKVLRIERISFEHSDNESEEQSKSFAGNLVIVELLIKFN